jgi:hypothetical protein
LAALVKKYRSVSFAGVQIGEVLCDHDAFGIEPGAVANPTAGVGRLVVIIGIPLDTQVGSPIAVAETYGGRQILANFIRALEAAQVSGLALSAADKKTHRARSARGADPFVPMTADESEQRD